MLLLEDSLCNLIGDFLLEDELLKGDYFLILSLYKLLIKSKSSFGGGAIFDNLF